MNATEKAGILTEALPYINQFRGRTFVIKYGGSAMDRPELREGFCSDIVLLKHVGCNPVIVHGGGPQIGEWLEKLSMTSRFVNGFRVTDAATMRVVEMVLGGSVNQDIVRRINKVGGRAVGLTGRDGGLVTARRIAPMTDEHGASVDMGFVGEVMQVHVDVVQKLSLEGFIPVIAPIAMDEYGESVNINADPFAAKIAAALHAEKLVLMTDTSGVKGADGSVFSTLTRAEVRRLIADKTVSGGMIPKVEFGLGALADGVRKVHIVDGRLEHALLLEIFTHQGIGTELVEAAS